MAIEVQAGRRWRVRAAAVAALATIAGPTAQADAERLAVTEVGDRGPGTLRAAVKRADRDRDRDVIGISRSLRGPIKLRRDLQIKRSLVVRGSRRRPVRITGPRKGVAIGLFPERNRPGSPGEAFLRMSDISARRVSLRADARGGSAELTIARTKLNGKGVDATGLGLEGAYYQAHGEISNSVITGFEGTGVTVGSYSEMRIDASTISRNTTGVAAFEAGVRINNSSITGNSGGGGVAVSYYAGVSVTKSMISGNVDSAPQAGGGGIDADYMASATVKNSTISGNSAEGPGSRGGGVYGNVRMTGSTVTGNSAEQGGGIFGTNSESGNFVVGSIVAGNASSNGAECAGVLPSRGNNVFGPAGCLAPGPDDVVVADAGLEPLRDNGGPTRTHALRPDSPAIDASRDLDLKTDQRGVRRKGTPDAGSFERR